MSVIHFGASRSRDVNAARAFSPVTVDFSTFVEPSAPRSSSPYGWKLSYLNRIWTPEGPQGNTAKSVLTVLWKHSDDKGRTWIGLQLLAAEAGVGNLRTVRNALERLVKEGWLQYAPQTWSSLTAEQQAVGRKAPRRGDVGQAPNLYELGQPVTRPGLVRTSTPSSDQAADMTPGQNCPGGPEQICPGEPPAKLPYDPDPVRSVPKEVSAEGEREALDTHDFSKAQDGKEDWFESWQIVAQTHSTKTKGVYGLAPMEPDIKRSDRKAMAECLDGASSEVAAKLRSRGVERELVEVRCELVERAMTRYFRNDTPHLRKTKHALRDLPREWHARVTEAMQAILRENSDKLPTRRPILLEQAAQRSKVEKPAETAPSAPTEKPMRLEETTALSQNVLKMLESPTPKEVQRPKLTEPVAPSSTPRAKPVLPDWLVAEAEQERARKQAQKPPQTPQVHRDESETIERAMGRPGAPRWGALSPRPLKVRRPRPVLDPEGTGGGGEPPSTE